MKAAFMEKTYTVRQIFRCTRWLLFIGVTLYSASMVRNAWSIKMGGIGIAQMRYADFPKRCQSIVDIHRGGVGGAPWEGIQDRTLRPDVQSLISDPECWGHAIRAGIDASPVDGGPKSRANVRLIFESSTTSNKEDRRPVAIVHVKYLD